MSNPWEVVFGTGHRPKDLSWQQRAWLATRLAEAARWMRDTHGTRVAITGMAAGFDLLWGQAAVNAGLELWAYIPFPQQADRWANHHRAQWLALRECATKERIFADAYSVGALHQRNDGMLNDAGAAVTGWRPDKHDGGTHSALLKAAGWRPGRHADGTHSVLFDPGPRPAPMPGLHLDPLNWRIRFELPRLVMKGDTPTLVVS